MKTFDIEHEEEPENSSIVSARLANSGSKYAAKTFTKGFFNQDEEPYIQVQQSNPSQFITKQAPKQEHKHKRRSRKGEPIKLEPMKQEKKVPVFENYNKTNDNELEEISFQPEKIEKKEPQPKKEERKEEEVKPMINLPIRTTPLIFHENNEEERQERPSEAQLISDGRREQHIQDPTEHTIPPSRQQILSNFNQNSEEDEVEVSENHQEHTIAGPQYFVYDSNKSLKKQLHSNIREGTKLVMELIRNNKGLCTFWPQFRLHFSQNSHFIMNAKKTSHTPTSTFVITCRRDDFDQKSDYYLGKMKSSLLGDVLNVFGPGLNPSNAKQQNQIPRQLIATIIYTNTIFQLGRPRQFYVYIKKPEVKYFSNFPEVRMYQDEIPLHILYQNPANRNKIKIYQNRKPEKREEGGGYQLNFNGRVEKASIKNFILEEIQNGTEIVMFGKVTESKFNLDMTSPISPFIAFAVALTSFDKRILCE